MSWEGPAAQYAEARRSHDQHQEHLDELWKENNPKCAECDDRSHKDKMLTTCGDEPVHEECSDICVECNQRYPLHHMEWKWTDEEEDQVCMDCHNKESQ